MALLLHIFVTVIFPVFIVIGIGYVFARTSPVDVRPFSRLTWWVTGPCLAFTALANSTVPDNDFFNILALSVLSTLIMWPVSALAARSLRLDRVTASAFQLSTMFGNVVNYGFSVLLFAFGPSGVERGVVFMMGNTLLLSTVAVFIASRGRSDWRSGLLNVTKTPMLYAALLGFFVNRTGIVIPTPVFEPLRLVGEISLMLQLMILGMQLSQVKLGRQRAAVGVAVGLRLAFSVLIGLGLALLLGIDGLSRQASLVEVATPTAVYATIIATEYDAAPTFAAAVIFVSTIASMGTLTVLMALLGVR